MLQIIHFCIKIRRMTHWSHIGISKCTNSVADGCNSTNMLENIWCSQILFIGHGAEPYPYVLYPSTLIVEALLSFSFFILLDYLTGYGLTLFLHRDSGTMLLHVLGRQQLLQLKHLGSEIYTIQQVPVLKGNLLIQVSYSVFDFNFSPFLVVSLIL